MTVIKVDFARSEPKPPKMTNYLSEQRLQFYRELQKILNKIATDEDKIEWIKQELDPLLQQCYDVGMEMGGEYQFEQGYEEGYKEGFAKGEVHALEQGDR